MHIILVCNSQSKDSFQATCVKVGRSHTLTQKEKIQRKVSYYYQAYGLKIQSDRELPELPVAESSARPADVQIRRGEVPEKLHDPTSKGVVYEASADLFLLKMRDIARYLVRNGNEIVIQPSANSSESDVRVFLLGSGFGALLHQRQFLVMHAGTIYTAGGAVLFCGPSGIGKSTLLGEMLRRGYKMMVDDVCGVKLDSAGNPVAVPGYPRTRLWADSAAKLDVDTTNLERTRPTLEKFERQLPECFHAASAQLHRIYLLTSNNKGILELKSLPAIRTFAAVLHNTYRNAFLDGLEMRKPHFSLVSAVATSVAVCRINRPNDKFKLAELADLVEEDFSH